MKVENYDKAKHWRSVARWLTLRGKTVDPAMVPPSAWIVEGVAVVGFYVTDGPFVLFEGFITNPDASSADRSEAIDLLTKHMLKFAGECGYPRALAFMSSESLTKRAVESLGFKSLGKFEGISHGLP